MKKIPLPVVILLCLGTILGSWLISTRQHDFLTPPTPAEIEAIQHRATKNLARPTDLFAIPTAEDQTQTLVTPKSPAEETPQNDPSPPKIDSSPLPDPLPLDLWTDLTGYPAASFVDLASRLETDNQFAAAHLAWERVIDHAKASPEEIKAAMNGIRRMHELEPSGPIHLHPHKLILHVNTPSDRLQLTRRAAERAASILTDATEGKITFEADVESSDAASISVDIQSSAGDQSAQITLPAPDSQKLLRHAILKAAHQSISATLAVEESLRPITLPEADEDPATSVQLRITRRAWDLFAKLFFRP